MMKKYKIATYYCLMAAHISALSLYAQEEKHSIPEMPEVLPAPEEPSEAPHVSEVFSAPKEQPENYDEKNALSKAPDHKQITLINTHLEKAREKVSDTKTALSKQKAERHIDRLELIYEHLQQINEAIANNTNSALTSPLEEQRTNALYASQLITDMRAPESIEDLNQLEEQLSEQEITLMTNKSERAQMQKKTIHMRRQYLHIERNIIDENKQKGKS